MTEGALPFTSLGLKKILLISDTHNYLEPRLVKYLQEADEVWHAGDIGNIALCREIEKLAPLKAVYGNADGQDIRDKYPELLAFDSEGLKVMMIHIGGYPGKYPTGVKQLLLANKPSLFICGHSHILKVMYDQELKLMHMNPGACGVHGFHKVKTALRFEVDKGEIKNASVIELGNRTAQT